MICPVELFNYDQELEIYSVSRKLQIYTDEEMVLCTTER